MALRPPRQRQRTKPGEDDFWAIAGRTFIPGAARSDLFQYTDRSFTSLDLNCQAYQIALPLLLYTQRNDMPIVPSPHVETLLFSQRSLHRVRDRALKYLLRMLRRRSKCIRALFRLQDKRLQIANRSTGLALATTTIQAGRENVVRRLLQRGGNSKLEGKQVLFALIAGSVAAMECSEIMVRILVEHIVITDEQNNHEWR